MVGVKSQACFVDAIAKNKINQHERNKMIKSHEVYEMQERERMILRTVHKGKKEK